MANNLDQQKEMNELLKQQNKLWAAQEKNLKNQTALMVSLVAAMKGISFKEAIDQVKELNNMLEETSELGTEAGTNTSRAMQSAAESAEEALDSFERLRPTMGGMIKNLKNISIASVAGQGAMRGFSFSIDMFKNITSGIAGLVSSLFNIGVAILSLPFQAFDALINSATGGSSEWRQQLEEVRKAFGDLTKNSAADLLKMERNLNGVIAETGLSTYRIFGNRAKQLEALRDYATKLGATFNVLSKSIASSANETERFAAYMKGLGMSDVGIKGVGQRAVALGTTVNEIGREITTFAFQVGEAFGINGRQISADVGEMIGDVANFGTITVKEMTQAAVFTRKLGLEFKAILGTIEAFDNFDKAAEGAAQLSQAFGMNIDAMQMIREEDPAARFETLRRAFFATGKSVESMTRQERALLAAQTGLTAEAVQLGFASKNQAMSYDQVQKAADGASKKQLTQEEAMQKLANSIDRLIQSGSQLQGGFIERFLQGFMKGIQRSREFREMFWSIMRALRDTYYAGMQVGRMFVQMFPGVKDVFKGIADIFNRNRFREMLAGVKQTFFQFFSDITKDPQQGVQKFLNALKDNFLNWFTSRSPQGMQVLDGLKNFFKAIIGIITQLGRIAIQGLIDGAKALVRYIKNPTDLGITEAADGFMGTIIEIFGPLWEMLVEMTPQLKDAIVELFNVAIDAAIKALEPYWEEYGNDIMFYMGLYFFGPALVGAFAGAIGSFFIKSIGLGLGNLVTGGALSGTIGNFLKQIAGIGTAVAKAPTPTDAAPVPSKGFLQSLAEGAKAISDMNIDWISAIKNAFLIGVMIAVGLAPLLLEIGGLAWAIQAAGISATSIALAGAMVAEAAVIVLAVGYMAKALAQVGNVAGAEKALVNIAVFIAALGTIAFVEIAAFIVLVQATGVTPEQVQIIHDLMITMSEFFVVAGGLALATIAISAFAAAGTAGLAPVGGFILALGGIMAILTGIMRLTTAGMSGAEVQSLANLISVVSEFMWQSIPLTIAAMALGAALAGPQALIAGGLLATAFIAIGATVAAALGAATLIITAARGIEMNSETENKVNIILRIFEILVDFINAFTDLISLARPSGDVEGNGGILTSTLTKINNFIGGRNGLLTRTKDFLSQVVTIATGIPPGQLKNIESVTSILSSVITFVSVITDIVKGVHERASWYESTAEAMDDFIRDTKRILDVIIGDGTNENPGIRVIATRIINILSGITAPPEQIATLAKAYGDILTSIGNFVSNVASAGKGLESNDNGSLTNLRQFITNTADALVGGVGGGIFGGAIKTLLTSLVDFAKDVSEEDVKKIEPVTKFIGPFFTSLGEISKSLSLVGGGLVSSASGGGTIDPAAITNLGTMFTGIFGALRDFLPTLITNLNESLRGVDTSSLRTRAKNLAPVFELITSVLNAVNQFYWMVRNAKGDEGTAGGLTPIIIDNFRRLFTGPLSFFTILDAILDGVKTNLIDNKGLSKVAGINVEHVKKLKNVMELLGTISESVTAMKSAFTVAGTEGGASSMMTPAQVQEIFNPLVAIIYSVSDQTYSPEGTTTAPGLKFNQWLNKFKNANIDTTVLSKLSTTLGTLSSIATSVVSLKTTTANLKGENGTNIGAIIEPIIFAILALTEDNYNGRNLPTILAEYSGARFNPRIMSAAARSMSALSPVIRGFAELKEVLEDANITDVAWIGPAFIGMSEIISRMEGMPNDRIRTAAESFNSLSLLGNSISEFKNSFDPAIFSDNSWMSGFFGGVSALTDEIARVNNDLINLVAMPIEIASNLQRIGESLGQDMSYRIETGSLNFTINLKVNLSADDVANILIDRELVVPGVKG